MTRPKRISTKKLQSLSNAGEGVCSEIHPEDGVDPAELFRPSRKRDSRHRKAKQLCQQVAETLSLVLSGDFDDALRELQVVAVTPAPDATQLLVLVTPALPGARLDPQAVQAKLIAAEGKLRREVANAITRKKAPRLTFQFIASPNL